MLTVTSSGIDTQVSGNGIECGTSSVCDGSRAEICEVALEKDTLVRLNVTHPVCATSGGIYFTFGFRGPCLATTGRICSFEITEDALVQVTGVAAAQGVADAR